MVCTFIVLEKGIQYNTIQYNSIQAVVIVCTFIVLEKGIHYNTINTIQYKQ
jgi:hypothetical protein